MGEFHRSSSKVWWASDDVPNWNHHRSTSSSPGSQDSGFSDTETSPKTKKTSPKKEQTHQKLDLSKNDAEDAAQNQNLSINVKDKVTPKKVILRQSKEELPPDVYYLNTPMRKIEIEVKSEPATARTKFIKNCQKVNRNLFRSIQMECTHDSIERDQYAKDGDETQDSSINNEVTFDGNISWSSSDGSEVPEHTTTLPVIASHRRHENDKENKSTPAVINEDEAVTSFTSQSPIFSDSDSELECLFTGSIDSPKHTSTPKVISQLRDNAKLQRKHAMNLLMKYQHERVPPLNIQNIEDGTALKRWMQEARQLYEPECITTLQCKSIAAELAEKVFHLAAVATSSLRDLLCHSNILESEFDNLKNQRKHIQPLAQSLAGLVKEFVEKFDNSQSRSISKQCEQLRSAHSENIEKLVAQLHINWRMFQQKLLDDEIQKLVEGLEDPFSEMDVRAKLTGVTSLALRNENLINLLTSSGIIPILVVLCEKCEGSSVRALSLRALSTICSNAAAIRHFERSSGVQVITDILIEDSRPEPERSEAVALLAQITAPWIEDNHNVRGLQDHTMLLVKALTRFLHTTKCCQNLLLCTAALANLTAMDSKCTKYLLHQNTMKIALDSVKRRGPLASVYVLEQVATLIANMSSVESARKQLTKDNAPSVLLCFLQTNCLDEDVIKRLQQKSIIALSRLCGEVTASQQVVELDGVEKLVKLCREKKERYDSDAVLVATLATLRKIAEACGASVISAQDAQELVEPRLLDSFLAYSTQNESLV